MIDCLTTPEFQYFLGLVLDVVTTNPDGTVTIGPTTWVFNGAEWCHNR